MAERLCEQHAFGFTAFARPDSAFDSLECQPESRTFITKEMSPASRPGMFAAPCPAIRYRACAGYEEKTFSIAERACQRWFRVVCSPESWNIRSLSPAFCCGLE